MSCNSYYSDAKVNIYQYLYFNKINDMQALILLCLENIWIIELLFKDNIKHEYEKKYGNKTAKKKPIY